MTARIIPGVPSKCRRCGAAVVFVRTLASPTGSGGKAMPLDPIENPKGNVAVRPTSTYSAVCRVLGNDDTLDRETEILAMTHFATCQPTIAGTDPPAPRPANVVDLATARAKRGRTR